MCPSYRLKHVNIPQASAPIGVFDSGLGGLTVARAIIDQLGFQGSTKLVEQGYKGFNIVLFEYTYYALSLTLGPVDLAQLEDHTLCEYQETFKCFIGPSLDEVKWVLDQLVGHEHSPGYPRTPAVSGEGGVKKTGMMFSREHCLRYDGKAKDRECLTALINRDDAQVFDVSAIADCDKGHIAGAKN